MDKQENKSNIIIPVVIVLVVIAFAIGGYMMFGSNKANIGTNDQTASSTSASANVATVNGVAITKVAYDTALASAVASYQAQGIDATSTDKLALIKTQVLDNLISNELLAQGVTASKLEVTPAEIEKEFQVIVTQSGGADGFKTALAKNNLTEAQLRENIRKQLLTQKYLLANIDVKSIVVSDAEIAKFYADYSKSQKDSGQTTVPTLNTLSAQIKQQLTADKQQALITSFIATLRLKANVVLIPQ